MWICKYTYHSTTWRYPTLFIFICFLEDRFIIHITNFCHELQQALHSKDMPDKWIVGNEIFITKMFLITSDHTCPYGCDLKNISKILMTKHRLSLCKVLYLVSEILIVYIKLPYSHTWTVNCVTTDYCIRLYLTFWALTHHISMCHVPDLLSYPIHTFPHLKFLLSCTSVLRQILYHKDWGSVIYII